MRQEHTAPSRPSFTLSPEYVAQLSCPGNLSLTFFCFSDHRSRQNAPKQRIWRVHPESPEPLPFHRCPCLPSLGKRKETATALRMLATDRFPICSLGPSYFSRLSFMAELVSFQTQCARPAHGHEHTAPAPQSHWGTDSAYFSLLERKIPRR